MITQLQIQNYKSHRNTCLSTKPLNILTGLNGSGKSSVIQSLLLLRQSHGKNRLDKALELNKPLCEIGTGKDALYQFSNDEKDFIGFSIEEANQSTFSWKFSAQQSKELSSMYLPLIEFHGNSDEFPNLSLFNKNFQYLSAGRLPGLKYERDDSIVEENRQLSLQNGYGELVAQYLFYFENEKINLDLKNGNNEFEELKYQVTAWEREISPNVNVLAKKEGETFTIKYSFDGNNEVGQTEEFRTENVGFGLTYALPIIVAILSAKKGALLLIENPEAHLHPSGQAKLAELIALAAQSGIQIFIETHSDHIINGILVASKKFESGEKGIDKNNVKLFYFGDKDERYASTFIDVEILEGGKINQQPTGFFDQTQRDLEIIMGF